MFLISISICQAETSSITKTKQSLNQLQTKIHALQQNLNQTTDKRARLKQALDNTDKQIQVTVTQLAETKQSILRKADEIEQLHPQIQALSNKLQKLRSQLEQYIVSQYKIGNDHAFFWFFTPNTGRYDQLLTYYQYIVKSNQQLIQSVHNTQHDLDQKRAKLAQDLTQLQEMKQHQENNQKKLGEDKKYRIVLLHSINEDISQKQQTLESYRRSQANLTKLLTTLSQQSVLQTKHPLIQQKRKLIKPVQVQVSGIQAINQGIVFRAPQGTPVYAVSPGKVVFSDWLNGYGNLIIVDHGWGFMTLYANNQALSKRKGEPVNQGEIIAKVGNSGTLHENGLYFEIRHRGKAVPPLEWLK